MKRSLITVAVLGLAASPAWAQLGGFSKPNLPSSGGATPQEVDKFLREAVAADSLVQDSSMHLLRAVVSKERVAEIEAHLKAAKEIQDPKEKQAKLAAVGAEVNAELAKADYDKLNEQLKAEHNAKKNESIRNSIWNLGLGSVKDVELVNTGKGLVSGVPSPAIADRIPAVKEAITRLVSQGDGLAKILGRAKSLMSTVGLENLPRSASEPPKIVRAD